MNATFLLEWRKNAFEWGFVFETTNTCIYSFISSKEVVKQLISIFEQNFEKFIHFKLHKRVHFETLTQLKAKISTKEKD